MLWEADQLEAMPLLPPDKRRIIQNFTNALTYVTGLLWETFFNHRLDAIKRYGVLGVGHMNVEPAPRAHAHGTGSTNICSWSRSPEIP